MNNDNNKKENQIENLVNLMENHTRTQRHLEQYSEIGNKENKEIAREKQDNREKEMEILKAKIISDNNETKLEQVQNLADNYRSAQSYLEDNYENLTQEQIENMQEKQENRKIQIEQLSQNVYETRKNKISTD